MTTLLAIAILMIVLATAAQAAHNSRPKHISPAREHVVQTLNRGLYDTPMAWTGRELEAAGWKWHVHPAFLAAITGAESSFGAAACRTNRFNAAGLGSCGSAWTPPYFRSWAHFYDYFARMIRRQWPSARSPWDMHGYCVDAHGNDCPTWPGKVAGFMRRLFGVGPGVRYP